eukprot:s2891_g13.t1
MDKRIQVGWEDLDFPMIDHLMKFAESFSKRKISETALSGGEAKGKHWAGSGNGLGRRWVCVTPRLFCVAGVVLGDICLRFVWQAWHLATSAFTLCGLARRWVCVTPRLFCMAGVALGDICLRCRVPVRGVSGEANPLRTLHPCEESSAVFLECAVLDGLREKDGSVDKLLLRVEGNVQFWSTQADAISCACDVQRTRWTPSTDLSGD